MAPKILHDAIATITRTKRDLPPAHYSLKIKSYSLLVKSGSDVKYESGVFEVGGYKWRLVLYPNGNKQGDGSGYISLHLEIDGTDSLPLDWQVFVNYKLFVFDQKHDDYLTIQDGDGAVRRFHKNKTEWGFDQLISSEYFMDSDNGYLVDDCCEFGAEVCVIKPIGEGEVLSMVEKPDRGIHHTFKLQNFSKLQNDRYLSHEFTVAERRWKLSVYPRGFDNAKDNFLSVYLHPIDIQNLPPNRKVYAEFKLRLLDQKQNNHVEKTTKHWIATLEYGFAEFLSLEDLHDPSKGYLADDTLIVEAEFLVASVVKVHK